ncbi:hypothetical protein Ciccas_001174 [Cichlidogyrus casuarinus]|uniref:Uncharacterized protein n=1 Tax=Cichlidogyrus casuarinus TaxID=1844966 RepID=A0ABD2QL97_9PLAT
MPSYSSCPMEIYDSLMLIEPQLNDSFLNESCISHMCSCILRVLNSALHTTLSKEGHSPENCVALGVFHIFQRLIEIYAKTPSNYSSFTLSNLFAIIRHFPKCYLHNELRMKNWWILLSTLPSSEKILRFRKFITPFLSMLIGKYISISAPDGDRKHTETLSLNILFL